MSKFEIPEEKKLAYLDRAIEEVMLIRKGSDVYLLKVKSLSNFLHKLRGSAATFSFHSLADLAIRLEIAIQKESFDQVRLDLALDEILEALVNSKHKSD